MLDMFEGDSNVTVASEPHRLKQDVPISTTEEGMHIDESDRQSTNAQASMHASLDPGSNVIVESAQHE